MLKTVIESNIRSECVVEYNSENVSSKELKPILTTFFYVKGLILAQFLVKVMKFSVSVLN